MIPSSQEELAFDGDGGVTGLVRGKILDTWFYQRMYELSKDGELEPVMKDFYERVEPKDGVTLLVPLSLSLESKEGSETFAVSAKTKGVILGCDDVSWCKAKFNGRE